MTSGGIKFTNFPENQLTTAYAFFHLVSLFISRGYNVNIKILVCQITGPAATRSAGLVPMPVLNRTYRNANNTTVTLKHYICCHG